MIYETINYLLTGTYNIYTLAELMPICFHLTNTIHNLATSDYEITNVAQTVQTHLKYKCEKYTALYKPNNYNESWHIGEYEEIDKVDEGAYASIVKIKRTTCGNNYAIKKIESTESAYVEIASLKLFNNSYIINLCDFDFKNETNLYLPYYSQNLQTLLKSGYIKNETKYVKQLTLGLHYCHLNDIIHRDIKTQNIIYDSEHDVLKLIDFGLAVPYSSKRLELSPKLAATIWFRAPEALLMDVHYTKKIDIWAMGLIFNMMISNGTYLFTSNTNKEMLKIIFMFYGKPTENTWPGVTSLPGWYMTEKIPNYKGISRPINKYQELINMCLTLNPSYRADTHQILKYIEKL